MGLDVGWWSEESIAVDWLPHFCQSVVTNASH